MKTFTQRLLLFVILAFCTSLLANESKNTVTLPLKEYMRLAKQDEQHNLTVLETTILKGQYGKNLRIVFQGAYAGKPEPISVLQSQRQIGLSDCKGSALLQMGGQNVTLYPQNKRFQLECSIEVKNWDNFHLQVLNSLTLNVKVKGADPIISGYAMDSRTVKFHRSISDGPSRVPALDQDPSWVARYQISVQPEDTQFQYFVEFNNPNRSPRTFKFPLKNEEVVQKITSRNKYAEKKDHLEIKLVPGKSFVRVVGSLKGENFQSPLKKGLEYLMIENHPFLTLSADTSARHISVRDSGMRNRFSAARAFLLQKGDQLTWTKKTLETFPSLSYTVTKADYRYFWAEEGSNLVEASYVIDNQGQAEIPLPVPGNVTYLEVNGQPKALAKDDKNQLVVRVPSGRNQQVTVQYQNEASGARGLASLSDQLARPAAVMSDVNVTFQFPRELQYFFAGGLKDSYYHLGWWQLLLGVFALLLSYKLFTEMKWNTAGSFMAGLSLGVLVLFKYLSLFWVVAGATALLAFHHREKFNLTTDGKWSWSKFGKVFGVVAIVFLALLAATIIVPSFHKFGSRITADVSGFESGLRGNAPGGRVSGMSADNPASQSIAKGKYKKLQRAAGAPAEDFDDALAEEDSFEDEALSQPAALEAQFGQSVFGKASTSQQAYQGLPAKIRFPNSGRHMYFNQGLVDNKSELKVSMFALSHAWMKFLMGLFFLCLLAQTWLNRKPIRAYLKI